MEATRSATHTAWAEIPVETLSTHIGRQYITGQHLMVARVLLAKDAHVPLHSHLNEQVACILSGALKFVLEGREVVVRAGEVLAIPPHLPHEAFALEDTVNLDIFSPPRQDWLEGNDSYLRAAPVKSEEPPQVRSTDLSS